MKLIIDIPEDMFEWFKNGEFIDEYDRSALKQIFKNGTPLDDVKAEILNYNVRKHVSGSESFLMGYAVGMDKSAEILDNIGKESEMN